MRRKILDKELYKKIHFLTEQINGLKILIKNGTISMDVLDDTMNNLMKNRHKFILDAHKSSHKISYIENKKVWYTYVTAQDGKQKQIMKKNLDDLEEYLVEYYLKLDLFKNESNITVEQLFNEWDKSKEVEPSSHQKYHQTFRRHFKEFGKRIMSEISIDEVIYFLKNEVKDKKLSTKGYNDLKTVMSGIIDTARYPHRIVDWNPKLIMRDAKIKTYNNKKPVQEMYFLEEEFDKMMEFLKSNPDMKNLGITLSFVTGIRIGELVALQYSDLEKDSVGFKIYIHKTEQHCEDEFGKEIYVIKETPKTDNGIRVVYIPINYEWVIDKLLEYNHTEEDFIFRDLETGERFRTSVIRRRLKRNNKKLGIDIHKSPHSIRRTTITKLVESGMSNEFITSVAGHSDFTVTVRHYIFDRSTDKQKAIAMNRAFN